MNVIEALKKRRSISNFDQTRTLEKSKIEELLALATEAPSSFNMQNWHFIAVTNPEAKKKLREVSMNQKHIEEAAVTFIILGDLDGHKDSKRMMELSVKDGILDQSFADMFGNYSAMMYGTNPQMTRDEAIRSGSLAGMSLMLAAEGMGMVSCPVIGFDSSKLVEIFGIPNNLVPVMLVPVGYEGQGNWAKKTRKRVHEIYSLEIFGGKPASETK